MTRPLATPTRNPGATGVGGYGPVTIHRYDEKTEEVIETLRFEGRIIGSATSEKTEHVGHQRQNWAPKNVKCSACRWLEVTLYRRRVSDPVIDTEGLPDGDNLRYRYDYVIYTVGMSDVPGEVDYVRLFQTSSAFEVIEMLTVRRRDRETNETHAFLPPQSARALAQAATIDDDIREAYVNRAVA